MVFYGSGHFSMLRDEFSPQNFGEPPPRRPLPPAPPQPGPAAVLSVRPRRRPPRPPPRLSSSAAGVQGGPACRAPCTAGVQGARPAACRGRLGQSGVGQAGPPAWAGAVRLALCAVPGAAAVCCRRWRTALPGAVRRAARAVPCAAAVRCRRGPPDWREPCAAGLTSRRKKPSAFAVRRAVRLAAWASGVLGGPPPPDGDGGEDARVAPVQGRRCRAAREGRGRVRRGGVDQGLTLTPIVSRCEL